MYQIGVIREFETRNFGVVVDAIEDNDIDLSWDDDGSVREGLNNGKFIHFTARARVFYQGNVIAEDYLGGCIYSSIDEFMNHKECGRQNKEYANKGEAGRCGSYFADMVKSVCQEARNVVKGMQQIKVRA